MDLSVVICTRNRASLLDEALSSLKAQAYPPQRFEIVIVDNGSTDATADTVRRAARDSRVPIRYFHLGPPGLSAARNLGWKACASPLVAFLDDDARAQPDWIGALVEAFENPSLGGVVGKTLPDWGAPPPAWLSEDRFGSYSLTSFGNEAHPLGPYEYAVGVNMAFRRNLLEEVGGFPRRIGRQGRNLISAEEMPVVHHLTRLGYPTWYIPSAVVNHRVHPSRLNVRWALRRSFFEGVSWARLGAAERPQTPAYRSLGDRARNLFARLPPGYSAKGMSLLCRVARVTGFALEKSFAAFKPDPA